jgi:hypothetical protein
LARKLVVETPYGTVTRESNRPYKFVVVSFGRSEAYLRSRHEADAAYLTKLAARYRVAEATGIDSDHPGDGKYFTAEEWGAWAADAETKASRKFEMPEAKRMVHGWSQSMKGASGMARTAENYGYLCITIVPVLVQ